MRTIYHHTPARWTQSLLFIALMSAWLAAWWSPPGRVLLDLLFASAPAIVVSMVGLFVIIVGLTWVLVSLFHLIDRTGRPAWFTRYKIQDPFDDPRRPTMVEAVRNVLLNQLLFLPPALLVLGLWLYGVMGLTVDAWPWWAAPLQLMAMGLITEVTFYLSHRFLHRRWWYARVHRKHHRYRVSMAISAQYAHWFEYLFGNLFSVGLALALVPADVPVLWFFALVAVVQTHVTHCGYNAPFLPWSVHHDLHHYAVNGNYGVLGLMDRLFGRELPPPAESRDGEQKG